jgi:hypothetical protein
MEVHPPFGVYLLCAHLKICSNDIYFNREREQKALQKQIDVVA